MIDSGTLVNPYWNAGQRLVVIFWAGGLWITWAALLKLVNPLGKLVNQTGKLVNLLANKALITLVFLH
jgi:hypothetical protein